jgi:hypothetical protein
VARLTASFWVSAYLRRLSLADIPAFIVHKGDQTAGAILVKSNPLDGSSSLFHRVLGPDGLRVWEVLARGEQAEIDATVTRQLNFDPDLWVIEVEDRQGRTLLDEEGLFG